jgi:hypothetical protein
LLPKRGDVQQKGGDVRQTGGAVNINVHGGGYGGGGGASASASASGAAGGAQQAAGALIAALQSKKTKKRQSGITAAKKRYTDKRKVKLGEMRALKSKRIREHAQKTKSLPKAQRDKQRREFREKAKAQLAEVSKRFPTARGLKDVKTVRELIQKIDRVRLPQ